MWTDSLGRCHATLPRLRPLLEAHATFTTTPRTTRGAGCGVAYTAEVTPVTIESNFAVRDGNVFNFLVGQQADFYVSAPGYEIVPLRDWRIGGEHINGVTLGGEGESPSFPGEWYYGNRDTDQSFQGNVDHASVYFEGDNDQTRATRSIMLYFQGIYAGLENFSRNVNIHKSLLCDMLVAQSGPCAIRDVDPTQDADYEMEQAYAPSVPGSGFLIYGKMTLPTLFTSVQGEGEWTYVQKCAREATQDGLTVISEEMGLDNTYPYGGYTHSSIQVGVDWRTTYGQGLLDFYDAPGVQVTGAGGYSDTFHADCFAVLRPPVFSGQSRVELPMAVLTWDYLSASGRASTKRWANVGAYRSYPNPGGGTEWATTPSTGSITNVGMREPVPSYEMDWSHVNMNQGEGNP